MTFRTVRACVAIRCSTRLHFNLNRVLLAACEREGLLGQEAMTEHDDALLRGLVDFAAALTAALIATWPQERGRERERERERAHARERDRECTQLTQLACAWLARLWWCACVRCWSETIMERCITHIPPRSRDPTSAAALSSSTRSHTRVFARDVRLDLRDPLSLVLDVPTAHVSSPNPSAVHVPSPLRSPCATCTPYRRSKSPQTPRAGPT
jgi:hypothetical protein